MPGETINVAVVGATGYTGRELLRILARHPVARVRIVTSRQNIGVPVSEIHPVLRSVVDLPCRPFAPDEIAAECAFCFCALPHGASMDACRELLRRGVRVVDLSADYRLKDPNVYAEWYGISHRDTEHLGEAVYGLPELFGDKIAAARIVANPGCYPTATILALAPLVQAGLVDPANVIVDAKSGVSGAGRSPALDFHFPECDENLWAYKVGEHRHTPEMEAVLREIQGEPGSVRVTFVPHIVPLDRGILVTVYGRLTRRESTDDLLDMYREYYQSAPFVRVLAKLPRVKDTALTNFCDISIRVVDTTVAVFAALDNLVKGASGTAVQNFNLMANLEETLGLLPV